MSASELSLEGGIGVVTGGAGTGAGLGRGLVREMAKRGMRVAILDVDIESAEALAEDIRSEGGKALAWPIDLAEPATIQRAAEHVRTSFGCCNILCAHAATGIDPLAEDLWSPEQWRLAMDGIVVGTAATVHAFLPLLRATDGPRRIVFTASSVALGPGRFQGPYRAAKVAVVSMAESLALELGPEGIETTIAFPNGITATEPEPDDASGADRAQRAVADALAGLDLPADILARFAAIGEEMANDPTDLATGDAVAAAIFAGAMRGRRYVITHGRTFETPYRERADLLEEAFADLALRGRRPVVAS